MARSGATFADAAAEWLRFVAEDRERKPTTLQDYRSIVNGRLLPSFGAMALEDVTPAVIEVWRRSLAGLSNRSKNKLLIVMHGIFRRAQTVYGLSVNPLARVEKHPQRSSGDIEVFSPEEVWALVRAAASEQDGALFLTAAFTGLRMGELLALHWRDVDFAGSVVRVRASFAAGQLTTPKSGKVRAVPLAPDVASALAALSRRLDWAGDDDLVFVGEGGGFLDGSALRRRYKAALDRAGLRSLRFHDLPHTFRTRMIAKTDIRRRRRGSHDRAPQTSALTRSLLARLCGRPHRSVDEQMGEIRQRSERREVPTADRNRRARTGRTRLANGRSIRWRAQR